MRLPLFLLALCCTSPALATGMPAAQEFRLSNGLKILVIEDHKIPAVTQMMWYHIGGADEQHGKGGLAHYLEHLMFKATDNLQAGEFSKLIAWYGGNDNAFTTADYTAYHQTIAKEHLPLAMLLESERMQGLKLDEKTSLSERDVILEERNMRVENNPGSLLAEKLSAALFGEHHPYALPVIGSREDISSLTYKDAQEFYRKYYAPNNATLVVAGDVTGDEVRALAEKYYGSIPGNRDLSPTDRRILYLPVKDDVPTEPIELKDKRVEQPEWMRYYLAPGEHSDNSRYAMPLVLAAQIFGGGETSRLYQALVVRLGVATSVGCWYDGLALGDSTIKIFVTPKQGVSFDQVKLAVEATLSEFVRHGPTKQEMQRARNLLRADAIYAQDNLEGMARIYGEAAATNMKTDYVLYWVDNMEKVTDDDVRAALKLVFDHQLRFVTGHLMPEGE